MPYSTPELIHEAVYYKQQGLSRLRIAERMSQSDAFVKTLLGKARKAWLTGLIPAYPLQEILPIADDRQAVVESEMDRRDSAVDNKLSKRDIGNEVIQIKAADLLREELTQHHGRIVDALKAARASTSLSITSGKPEEAWMVVSDLHHMRQDNGVTEATTAGALDTYDEHCGRILNLVRTYAYVDTLNVALLGDLFHGIANYLFQDREVSGNSSQQIAKTAWLLIEFILKQKMRYERVNIYAVPGNHGRKSERQNVYNDNLELDMYRIIEAYFAKDPQVTILIADEDFKMVVDSMGYKFLLMHGNSIKAGNPQGLINSIQKYEMISEPFNSVIMGHFHRLLRLSLPRRYGELVERSIFVNGTASRDDTFLSSFGSSPSLSWWYLLNNSKRVTSTWDIPLYA